MLKALWKILGRYLTCIIEGVLRYRIPVKETSVDIKLLIYNSGLVSETAAEVVQRILLRMRDLYVDQYREDGESES